MKKSLEKGGLYGLSAKLDESSYLSNCSTLCALCYMAAKHG